MQVVIEPTMSPASVIEMKLLANHASARLNEIGMYAYVPKPMGVAVIKPMRMPNLRPVL